MHLNAKIVPYQKNNYLIFKNMFKIYFLNDFKCDLSEEDLNKICSNIEKQVLNSVVFLDLIKLNQNFVGFIIYQIDSNKSDWCEKEGHGFIREIFISSKIRKLGFGKSLAENAEKKLFEFGVPQIYLTSDENYEFWIKLGYVNSGEVCTKNESPIFYKPNYSL